jgi:Matrixin
MGFSVSHPRSTHWQFLLILAVFVLVTRIPAASACTLYGSGYGSKWDDPVWPAGAVITWSYITPGAGPGSSGWSGTNTLGTGGAGDIRASIDAQFGAGAFDAAVARAFATWAAAANVQFVQVADQGGDFGTVTNPDIRIGAYDFGNAYSGGAGFGPPGDDLHYPDALAGDIALNNQNHFSIDPGSEGDPLQTGPSGLYLNDLEGLVLHEIGHTLGMGHSTVPAAVMCGYFSAAFDGSACDYTHVNRVLDADDLDAVDNIYGPAPAPDGDVSFDCTVDVADVLLAAQAVGGQRTLNAAQFARADVAPLSGGVPAPDTAVNAADLLLILRKSIGLGWPAN